MSAKTYTIDDLQAHKSRESLYLLLSGKVYDVTQFLDEHPGGDEVLLEEGGRDATEAFEDVGHSDEARDMLPKMLLGSFDGPTKVAKAAGSTATAASGGSTGGDYKFLLPVAVLIAWIAYRFLQG
ncbi:Cytochrome b5 [Vanrija pseudolonga]|uniref:Cytochrome b5 n=1 Tax=Vanrija pseudolonga TaxID=143232 RepID=A0AAF0Y8K7_9TREE|nr:Cytochrome b5 [Vanrija pseudolonga]